MARLTLYVKFLTCTGRQYLELYGPTHDGMRLANYEHIDVNGSEMHLYFKMACAKKGKTMRKMPLQICVITALMLTSFFAAARPPGFGQPNHPPRPGFGGPGNIQGGLSFYSARNAYARARQVFLYQIPAIATYCRSVDYRNQVIQPMYTTVFQSDGATNSIHQYNYQGSYVNSVTTYAISAGQTFYNNIGVHVQSMRYDGRNVWIERSGGAETGTHGIDNPGLPVSHYFVCSP